MTQRAAQGVARIWRGRTASADAEVYADYLYENGVKKLESLGAQGVQMFREDRGSENEFMVISYWESLDAMTAWAGVDPTRIRHLERDRELLVELPVAVQILAILSDTRRLSEQTRSDP